MRMVASFAHPASPRQAAATVKALPYDPVKDLQPVTQVMRGPYVLVAHPSFAPNSVPELIAYAKANPGKLNFGAANGGTVQLSGELFKMMPGVNIVHVPYRS